MTKKEILLTSEGFTELEEQLAKLKTVDRPKVIEEIKEARSHGDLSENADYDAARTLQAEIESEIKELEYKLGNATIIQKTKTNGKVSVGSEVIIKYLDDNEEETYNIVGSLEADPFNNKISNESPIGKALIGKKKDDEVDIESPNGSYKVKIINIS